MKPELCLTFDDDYVLNWVQYGLPLLEEYNAKATFFLSGVHMLTDEMCNAVPSLQAAGHEIGAHGALHTHIGPYVQKKGLQMYFRDEVEDCLIAMADRLAIPREKVNSFAYPYGEYVDDCNNLFTERTSIHALRSVHRVDPLVADSLLEQVTATDGLLNKAILPTYSRRERNFVSSNGFCYVFTSVSTDAEKVPIQMYENAMRSMGDDDVLVTYGHNIAPECVDVQRPNLTTRTEKLSALLELCGDYGIDTCRMKDIERPPPNPEDPLMPSLTY